MLPEITCAVRCIAQLQTRVFADETVFDDSDRLCPAQPHNSPRRAAGGRGDGGNRVVEREHEFTLAECGKSAGGYFPPRCFFRFRRAAAPLPSTEATARVVAAGAPLGLMVFGNSFFSAMPHRLDEIMYKHNPLGTA